MRSEPAHPGQRPVGIVLGIVAFALLAASLFVPWYMYQLSASGPYSASETTSFYIGNGSNAIQYTCTGAYSPCPPPTNYGNVSGKPLPKTGQGSVLLQYLVFAAIALGVIGVIVAAATRRNPGRARAAMAILVVAGLVALAAPITQFATQPMSLHSDTGSSDGPAGSFFGSNSTNLGSGETVSSSWGPTYGWYVALAAFVLLLVGGIAEGRARKPGLAPATSEQPAGAPTGPEPSSPPAAPHPPS
ncbi:MAG: hypothetical protein QXG65_06555 [Thermoplasmata archaeon]